jgi:hypothetical protein
MMSFGDQGDWGMGVLSALVSVAFLVYLLLRISKMVGGTRTVSTNRPEGDSTTFPKRSEAEIDSLLASMPTAWVVYDGMTPALNLKIRGMTEELYRRFTSRALDDYGRQVLNSLPYQEMMAVAASLLPSINAEAYVVEWNGAQYPNGNPLPATVDNLAMLIRNDEMLRNFISNEAERLSPT